MIQESEELRRDLFKTKISLLIKDNPDFSDIPFAYCDVNKQILCTPAIYDIFEIKKEESLTMRDLLDCVGGEERKGVFEAFKKGIRLKNYRLKEDLTLNSYPLFYGELPVGVGVFLIDSERNLSRERNYSFARKVLTEVKKISEDYRFLRASLELAR